LNAAENVVRLEPLIDRRWREYCEAAVKAQQSRSIDDGRIAGRAWRAWLDLFEAKP
jgi:hypothetical protein